MFGRAVTSLVGSGGEAIELPVGRWRGAPDEVELALLDTLPDPVLDVGCGPGRIGAALGAAGLTAVALDLAGKRWFGRAVGP